MDGMFNNDFHSSDFLLSRWLSEKMDGVRAYWNGEKLISRHGTDIPCPDWFIEGFSSNIHLDGELWLGRGQYEDTTRLLHGDADTAMWKLVRYVVFDLPRSNQLFED